MIVQTHSMRPKSPLGAFEQSTVHFSPKVQALTVFSLFPEVFPLPGVAIDEVLRWQEWFFPDVELQAQGALLTGAAGFLEIAKNCVPRHCLIHRLRLRLTHSLPCRFFHSDFNYIMGLLFSALIYSLSVILVSSDIELAHLWGLVWNVHDSGNRIQDHTVFLQLVCADTPGACKIHMKKEHSWLCLSSQLPYEVDRVMHKRMQEQSFWERPGIA